MSNVPEIYEELIKIVDEEPEDNIFSKLAKYDLKYRIYSDILRRYDILKEEAFELIFKEVNKLDIRYLDEIATDFLNLLIEKKKYKKAIEFIRANKLDERIFVDLVVEKVGLDGLDLVNIVKEELRDEMRVKIWLKAALEGSLQDAFEEIKKIKNKKDRVLGLFELANISLEKKDTVLTKKIIRSLQRLVNEEKDQRTIHLANLLKLKCKVNSNCLEYYDKIKNELDIRSYIIFLPALGVKLLQSDKREELDKLLNKYITETRDERIYLELISELAKSGLFNQAQRYILRIKDPLIAVQSYANLIKQIPDDTSKIINLSKLAIDNLTKWFDDSFLLLRQMAERVKKEDKNYEKLSLSQILFYHPQISAYFRNITAIFQNTLKNIVNILIEKDLLDHAIHILNYICTMKRLGCDLRASVEFEIAWRKKDYNKAKHIIKNSTTASLIELTETLVRIKSDPELPKLILDALIYFAKTNQTENIRVLLPLVIEKGLNKEALEAIKKISDEKIRLEMKLMIANKLSEEGSDEVEDIIAEANQFIEKYSLEESSNFARLLAQILFRLGRYDEVLNLVKKYLKAKDKWLAGLIISSIFKK